MKRKRRTGNFIGTFYSAIVGKAIEYFSLAERVILCLIENNPLVKTYCTQELEIPVYVGKGEKFLYKPDILVEYQDGSKEVIEVKKTKADAEKKPALLRRAAAEKFCEEKGWKYTLICEEEIDPIHKKNIKFLFSFRNRSKGHYKWAPLILDLVASAEMSIGDVVKTIGDSNVLPLIYYMIFNNELVIDLSKPLTLDTKIKVRGE